MDLRQEEILDPGLPSVDPHHHLWERIWNACKLLSKGASAPEKADLFSGAAARFYRLELPVRVE